ncbi:hypothetical protein C0989_007395, partial [Termitomyces sp. Mn162]
WALYKDIQGVGCELQEEDGCKGDFTSTSDPKSPDMAIKVGDMIYAATLHLRPLEAEI